MLLIILLLLPCRAAPVLVIFCVAVKSWLSIRHSIANTGSPDQAAPWDTQPLGIHSPDQTAPWGTYKPRLDLSRSLQFLVFLWPMCLLHSPPALTPLRPPLARALHSSVTHAWQPSGPCPAFLRPMPLMTWPVPSEPLAHTWHASAAAAQPCGCHYLRRWLPSTVLALKAESFCTLSRALLAWTEQLHHISFLSSPLLDLRPPLAPPP